MPDEDSNEKGREPSSTDVSKAEREKAEKRSAISATIVHEAIRQEGEYELGRPSRALMWSGLASGLSMGFSFISQGLLSTYVGSASWAPLLTSFGYTIGFLIVVLGRQQLFTENTLTAIIPFLNKKSRRGFLNVLRLWTIVLISNLVGAFIVAWFIAASGVFGSVTTAAFLQIGLRAFRGGFTNVLFSAIFAGWLIALMVWLLPAAETARVWIIIIITYFIGLAGMDHVIAGSVDTFYLVVIGNIPITQYLMGFLVPSLIGNVVGGVLIVAVINHAQVVAGS